MNYKRHRKPWTINELLQLERNYELLELSINEISQKHQRSPRAIMNQLDKEGIASYSVLYSQMPEFIPKLTLIPNNIDNDNIYNETLQEIISLVNMQKNMTHMNTQINDILSIVKETYNNIKIN